MLRGNWCKYLKVLKKKATGAINMLLRFTDYNTDKMPQS